MIVSMLLALADVQHEAIVAFYESGFRSAAGHRGHGLGYDPVTGQWMPADNREWGPEELDEAMADRRPVLLDWLRSADVPHYLREAGVDAVRVGFLRRLLRS